MPIPSKRLQPRAYHAFRCIGAECEDTCCSGWLVNVDKSTYDAYQRCEDAELGPRLRELVTIHAASTGDDNYARIALSGSSCPFLDDGLCGIQKKLGETYLSAVCARFPRVMSVVDDVLHRSLNLSCPEAARLLLLDPNPMEFDEEEGQPYSHSLGALSELHTTGPASAKPDRYYREIRSFSIEVLQYREYPLWKRLVVLASFCDQLQELADSGQNGLVADAVQWFRQALESNRLDQAIHSQQPQPVLQLGILLELIVARIAVDFTSPRFFECYREFKDGIEWTSDSSMEQIAERHRAAFSRYYLPFLRGHEHMLEHYLVNYVHRSLFPLGPQEGHRDPTVPKVETMRDQCLVMLISYGVIQTVLIGVAAFRRDEFGPGDAIRVVQSVTKAFEHNISYPERALKILAEKGLKNCVSMAILLRH